MQKTHHFNQVTKDFTIDQYLHQLVGFDVDEDSLLRLACEMVWDFPFEGAMPNSLDVALLLSELGTDETTLTVALLSSTSLMESADAEALEKTFGHEIMELVRSVVQLHDFRGEQDDSSPEQVERLRRMLLSMVDDVRAVLIKLAFRVQRLRQLKLADVIEQQESYPHSLRPVVRAAACSLHQLEFKIERIEISDHQAYLAAFWGETRVRLEFEAITPTLTRIESRMIRESAWRDYASEKELFLSVRRTLDGESSRVSCRWRRVIRDMVPLYCHPESGAAIIAYLSPGLSISVNERESQTPRWAAITLELGGFAYLDKNTYSLKPELSENSLADHSS